MAKYNYGKINANGVQFMPQELSIKIDSLADENSGRTQDGVMRINWIWNKIRKVEVKLPPMNGDELSRILSAVQGQVYNITYFDTLDNRWETRQVYTSNSSADCYSGIYYGGLWQNASFNAIEIAGENDAPYVANTIELYNGKAVLKDNGVLAITSNGSETYMLMTNDLYVSDDSGATYRIENLDLIREE